MRIWALFFVQITAWHCHFRPLILPSGHQIVFKQKRPKPNPNNKQQELFLWISFKEFHTRSFFHDFFFQIQKEEVFLFPNCTCWEQICLLGKAFRKFRDDEIFKKMKDEQSWKRKPFCWYLVFLTERIFVTSKTVCQIGNDFAENPKSPST